MSERYAAFVWSTPKNNVRPMGKGTPFWDLVGAAFPKHPNVRFMDGYRQDHGDLVFEFFNPDYDGVFSHAKIFAKTPAAELWFLANMPADCRPFKHPQPIPKRVPCDDDNDVDDV